MCGRYAIYSAAEALVESFDPANIIDFAPRYNAAPGQDLPVIVKNRAGFARWGFLPAWGQNKDMKPQINARLETVQTKPMFADAIRKRRCLVPANGFYEWAKADGGKQPFYIHATDDAPLAFAGIWSKIEGAAGPQVTFAIVTKPAIPAVADIHARMPVILDSGSGRNWLYGDVNTACETAEKAAPQLMAYPVSSRINKPAEDDAGLLTSLNA